MRMLVCFLLCFLVFFMGCAGANQDSQVSNPQPKQLAKNQKPQKKVSPKRRRPQRKRTRPKIQDKTNRLASRSKSIAPKRNRLKKRLVKKKKSRQQSPVKLSTKLIDQLPAKKPVVHEAKLFAHGIRKLQSRHLTLYTDLPKSPEVDQLGKLFDLAVSKWCQFFSVNPKKVKTWHLHCYLIKDKQLFRRLGVLTNDLPDFLNGYQTGWNLYVYEQPSAYYRRHLLLHEGTHAFMRHFLQNIGPLWYGEGMAELLATHHFKQNKLTLNYFPRSRDEAPFWGRVKIIKRDVTAGKRYRFERIIALRGTEFLTNKAYGWSWAMLHFLEHHPRSATIMKKYRQKVTERSFNRQLIEELKPYRAELVEDWLHFITKIDYGYDVAREALLHQAKKNLSRPTVSGKHYSMRSSRGWQSTGMQLIEGTRYQITASGLFQIRAGEPAWKSGPGGVTIEYYQNRPLGQLLGSIRSSQAEGGTSFSKPIALGMEKTFVAEKTGLLYLRVNEQSSGLADNQGEIKVLVKRVP